MQERHVLFIMDFKIWKPFSFSFVAFFTYFWVFWPFTIKENVKCSENQFAHSGKWKLKCTCLKALFSKIHLPGLVLMSVLGAYKIKKNQSYYCNLLMKKTPVILFDVLTDLILTEQENFLSLISVSMVSVPL